jgi:hypothetical protein
MTQLTIAATGAVTRGTTSCDPATRTTKTRLAYGVVAGPLFVVVSLAQALTRDGFDLARHQWSLLANGGLGWLQVTNFLLAGAMTVALAVGLRRALTPGQGGRRGVAARRWGRISAATWAPRLVGAYGASLVAAGVFRADPALGFPAGTPDGPPAEVSWHGLLHFVSGGIGFACLIAACLVVARRFTAERRRGWAAFSRITGVVFLAGFAGVATGAGTTWLNLAFVAAVLLAWAWVSALAVHLYRRTAAAV